MVSEAAVLQMSKSLNLTIVLAVGCILVGCAAQSVVQKPLAAVQAANSHLGRMSNVRTTAYTRIEKGGRRNALGKYLSGHHVMSAASDWSRFPLGTPVPNRRHERRIYYRRLRNGVDRHQHDRSLQADQAGDETLGRAQCRHRRSAVGLREAKSQSAGPTCKTSDTSTHDRGASKKERRSCLEGS
jgi:hypothetical protein